MDRQWISLHIFHHGDLDSLLLEGLRPLVLEMFERGDTSRYFFVRYWNGGPHVRLRVLPAPGVEGPVLAQNLCRQVSDYLATLRTGPANPEDYRKRAEFMREFRSRFKGDWEVGQAHLDIDEPFQSADTVQLRDYEFDYPRYGGSCARDLTEEHFFRSSKLAFSVLLNTRGDQGTLHAWALTLMAIAVAALGVSAAEASRLFWNYFNACNFIFNVSPEGFDEAMGFRSFESQPEQVIEIIRQAEQGLGDNQAIARWRKHLSECVVRLDDLHARALLSVSVADIFMDYLHMLNNRLGVALPEELYLAGLLAKGYRSIEKTS
jgi:thiopeptide-type bacteriocin biosynthesis protein